MALRSRPRMSAPTSGPGRPPASDGRFRHRRPPRARGPVRHGRRTSAEELRRRAETLFARHGDGAERVGEWQESGKGPPGRAQPVDGWVDGGPGGGATVAGSAVEVAAGSGSRRERVRLAVRERMPVWLQTRCGLERRGVVALTVVLVAAAGFAAVHFWTGRTETVRPPEVVETAAYEGDGEGAGDRRGGKAPSAQAVAPGAPGATAAPGGDIVVDVSGKVREPGVHRLPAGSRVEDALRAAGGVRPGTNTDGLNRARFLVDGEQVSVGTSVAGAGAGAGAASGGGAGPVGGAAGAAPGAASAAPLSLNTATVEQLDTLPGVGPVLAGHIVTYRTEHGGFRSVDELREVDGIGERRFADLRNLVRP
ncbi:ComEA family DNA-binding protein [Streptomyces fumanus]|uniref:ComEA family DNA-binding protein n=1 Tax=Streptomyces fumanus TaxID=67302 RepID=UPI0033F1D54A